MNDLLRPVALLAGTAAVVVTLAVGLPAAGAQVHNPPTIHRLTFVSHELAATQLGNSAEVASERLIRNGRTIGYAAIWCRFDFATNTARCQVGAAFENGTLDVRSTFHAQTGSQAGVVTGGTGVYRHAAGTVSGHPGAHANETVVTIEYHT